MRVRCEESYHYGCGSKVRDYAQLVVLGTVALPLLISLGVVNVREILGRGVVRGAKTHYVKHYRVDALEQHAYNNCYFKIHFGLLGVSASVII